MAAVEKSIEIKASPATVWRLFATQEGMRSWFHPEICIDMRVGGAHRHFSHDTWISGEVLAIEPGRSLTLSWMEEESDWLQPTRVTFTLEPITGGTRVHARHEGFEGVRAFNWERTFGAYTAGWEEHGLLSALKKVAEQLDAA